jgi:hypothetical protein
MTYQIISNILCTEKNCRKTFFIMEKTEDPSSNLTVFLVNVVSFFSLQSCTDAIFIIYMYYVL